MQARECEFRLAAGRKCRAAANRNQPFCRHHAPKPAVPAPPPLPKEERYSNLSRWRQLGSQLHSMPLDEIPYSVWQLLQCLVDRGLDSTGSISDLTAGRFLRVLLTRFGDVPFPDPDLAAALPNAPASGLGAVPEAPAFRAPDNYSALLAALGLHARQSPWPQTRTEPHPSRTPVNQSKARANQ